MKTAINAFLILISANTAHAVSPFIRNMSFVAEGKNSSIKISIWSREDALPSSSELNAISESLKEIAINPLFSKRLPTSLALLIDNTWTKTSGYWSSDLKSPTDEPAVLVTPQILNEESEIRSVLVHELAHLAHFQKRPLLNEEAWLREGVALLTEYVVTGQFNASLREAFSEPDTSLTAPLDAASPEYGHGINHGGQYGHLLLYFHYIHRLCGGEALLNSFFDSSSKKTGITFLDELLPLNAKTNAPACSDFRNSFLTFEKARFDPSPIEPWGYTLITSLKPTVRKTATPLEPYSAQLYAADAKKNCEEGDRKLKDGSCFRIRTE